MRISLAQALEASRGELVKPGAAGQIFAGIAVDSRRVAPSELFIAIRGAIRDAHDFVGEACQRGASGLLVERWPLDGASVSSEIPVIRVADSLHAFGEIARSARASLKAKVVAITGTAGKTTTKAMTVEVINAAVGAVFSSAPGATERSENNLVGLPMTLLRLTGDEPVVVLEMGMNALGEIARLTEIADPDIGLVTNIGMAHLQPSASSLSIGHAPQSLNSLQGVIRAKRELWAGMRPEALAVVNLDDSNVVSIAEGRANKLTYSRNSETAADVRCENPGANGIDGQNFTQNFTIVAGGQGAKVTLRVLGEHNLSNALAAGSIGAALGIPPALIAQGLAAFTPVDLRGETVALGADILCINDAYNANPLSMAAALKTLAGLPGARRIAALGDMRELGDSSSNAHREIGALVANLKIDYLLVVGEFAKDVSIGARRSGMSPTRITAFSTPDQLGTALRELLRSGDRVLLKASRAVSLETVLGQFGKAKPH
jgi:UDP-N-acetylmuramoyl-tripeptide--D-alanyl-D-alanine ligase